MYELDGSEVTGITTEHIVAILMDSSRRKQLLLKSKSYIPLLNSHGHDLLHKIISGVFDADRLNYLRRDALQTCIVYGTVDIDRIIDNIHAVGTRILF